MSGPFEDPLYRSDSRTVNSGSQQADLAPVSAQPSEHWEQQAAQRDAEEPAAPTDPLGAQPQTETGEPDPTPPPSADNGVQPTPPSTATPTAQTETASAPSPSSGDQQTGTVARDMSTGASADHDTGVTLGGEIGWTDPSGDHVRSGEVSVDISQATSLGATSSMMMLNSGEAPAISAASGALDTVAQGVLAQASALAEGGLGLIQNGALTEAIGQIAAGPSALDLDALPALGDITGVLGDPAVVTDTLLDQVTGVVDSLALDALPDLADAAPIDAVTAPSGLLAALFTPEVGEPADLLGGGVTETALDDAAPDFHLTGLTGGLDDHTDLALGLGL